MFFFNRKTAAEKAAESQQLRHFWTQASPASVEDKIEEIVADEHSIQRSDVHNDLYFWKDLDDSLDFVELLMRCEEEFELELPDVDVDAQHIHTVRDLKNYILKKLGKTS